MLTVRCLDLNEWRLAQGKGPFIRRDTIRDMYGMRDVENIYRDQYGTARKFGSGCGIEELYWEAAKQALIYSLIFLTKQTTDLNSRKVY